MTGLKPNQLLRLEHLYRRRVPVERVVTPELARAITELSQEVRCQIGLLISRRGVIEQVIVGDARELVITDLSRFTLSRRTLRGLRLVHTHLKNEPLTHDDLTDLALLRLDLIAAIGVGPDGLPGNMYVAHLLPPNPQGKAYEVFPSAPFHTFQMACLSFIESLEDEIGRTGASHVVKAGEESAILISAAKTSRGMQEERLEELEELVHSDGIAVLEKVSQRPQEIHPKYLLGSGKLKQVVIQALQRGADLLIFDQDLTPGQARAIAELTEFKVIDRTQLILDIFARRAHSREGKIQVELAQLRYLLPRLSGRGEALSRLGGGIGARGPGETKLETDRRRVRDRIAHLEKEMAAVARHRDQRRARRVQRKIPIISIVGYTNAGKSTLLNTLTDSHVAVQDRLFETLDTSSRRLRLPRDQEVIITDTVGFIRDLPKDLVVAFRTTLEELRDADLLLHLVDATAKDPDAQIKAVETILTDLEIDNIPRVLVLNKCDKLAPGEEAILARRYEALGVSAMRPETLKPMMALLQTRLAEVQRPVAPELLRRAAGEG